MPFPFDVFFWLPELQHWPYFIGLCIYLIELAWGRHFIGLLVDVSTAGVFGVTRLILYRDGFFSFCVITVKSCYMAMLCRFS